MQSSTDVIFLTGVTGTLGKELIKELLKTTDSAVWVLARGRRRVSADNRVRKILIPAGLESSIGPRVRIFEGDVTLPKFGLDERSYGEVVRGATHFFHVAALTALNGSKEDCERINIGGTEHALELARDAAASGRLKRFYYFSTAYVAGSKQTYCSKEDELCDRGAFANFYESSKNASERQVRAALAKGLPATIFRPSIVVGDSKTGEVSEFNVIYPFIKLFAHGILKQLPTRLENSFNIVPIDFVVQAALTIAKRDDSIGHTYHLVTKEPPTIGMLLELKRREYPLMPNIEVIRPEEFKREGLNQEQRAVFQMMEPYLGYLNDDLTFDASNTEKALEGTDVTFPKTDYQFLKTLITYAIYSGYLLAP